MRVAIVGALLVACGGAHAAPAAPRVVDGVLRYESPPRTFRTNAFFIDAPDGLIMIDTGFLASDAAAAIEHAEQVTGKRVVLGIVLHPNPDKFNGAHLLNERGVRVITSAPVIAHVPRVHAMRHRAFASRYPGYPATPPRLEPFGDASTELEVAGTTIGLHVLGPGCSDAHVAVRWRGHLFVGDLVANRHHAWLELGYVDAWRARLEELAALGPTHVHPGRGASGGPELLTAQRTYLDTVEELVAAHADADAAQRAIEARYPGYGHAVFLRIGVPAVRARQVAAPGEAPDAGPP